MNSRKYDNLNPGWIVETALTWLVVFALMVYGFGKLIQFQNIDTANELVSNLSGMELMWTFYAYSQPYVWILGLMEVLGATLLFFKKTRILGCLFSTTIFINVILQDIFYEVNIGALRAAVIYQIGLIVILLMNRKTLLNGIHALLVRSVIKMKSFQRIKNALLALVLFMVLRYVEYLLTH